MPDDLGAFYPADYYGLPDSRSAAIARDANAAHRVELVRRLVPRGRLVEVGPSIGAFVARAQDAGYETSAIEMDPECCRFIGDVLGVPVVNTTDPASALEGPYDAIVMWHVIEHLADPATFVARAAETLAPGGMLVLATPNPASLQARLLGSRWAHVDAPRHLGLMPREALAAAGARHGLEVALSTTADADADAANGFGWRVSFGPDPYAYLPRRALRIAGHALSLAIAPVERRDGRGSSYTLALRKPV